MLLHVCTNLEGKRTRGEVINVNSDFQFAHKLRKQLTQNITC